RGGAGTRGTLPRGGGRTRRGPAGTARAPAACAPDPGSRGRGVIYSAAPGGSTPRARAPSRAPALPTAFYDRDAAVVARELLGAVLVCETEAGLASGRIVETEAYLGPDDPACHAVSGRTARTEHLFGPPGRAYVYLIYGMHWCFNAVTREEGHGSAALVRALEPLEGVELMRARRRGPRHDRDLTNGPAKLCEALAITREHDGLSLVRSTLTIRRGAEVPGRDVVVTPRIGITRAADWPLRYFVAGSDCVSRTPPHFPRESLPG
ncbi:MAG: DNA-3-methyladenine glycosylase, partial [Gemmatimonadaceae bacterium]